MAPRATFDDVNLIVKLYEMRREPRLREARMWFAASFKPRTLDEFRSLCPPGSDANASYRMVTTYWEMVASFLINGVLNPELFYQSAASCSSRGSGSVVSFPLSATATSTRAS
jgi:hypothetical protein